MNRVVQVFFNSDLRCGLDGLTIIAKKAGVNSDDLSDGEFLVFINKKKNMMRVFHGNMFTHYRPESGRVNYGMIQHLPRSFNGTKFDFSEALKRAVLREIAPGGRINEN